MLKLSNPSWLYRLAPRSSSDVERLSSKEQSSPDVSRQSLESQNEADRLVNGQEWRKPRTHISKTMKWYWWCSLFCNILLLLLSGTLITQVFKNLGLNELKCTAMLSASSPALDSVEYEFIKFQGALDAENRFKGAPNDDLDQAWDDLVNMGRIRVSKREFDKLGKPTKGSVQYPDGSFQGGLEVFHQLHCLNYLRQSTYPEYYEMEEHKPEAFHDSAKTRRLHLDHCIDMLRQAITCYGDTGIVTASWVEGREGPYPDFSTWHKCRKLEPLSRYTDIYAGPPDLKKPDDAFSLSEPPV
ncbi:hypothetical protein AFLA70_151g001870 [Aspergillus flavus AF70]|nr:hypothetical protein AFLA70_151g001870 [Aspergillus flavus AF70]